jgi:opacity protein-like surface antigen
MDMDKTLVPMARGAVFVPCMSDPLFEPPYALLKDGKIIATAPVGQRIIARPGLYTVEFGSGARHHRVSRPVQVRDGKTTLVVPDWSGLQVQVVDENSVPFRGLYEVISLPSMENLGVGHGAQVEQGENVRTWIMEPGLYMLLKVGESYQARKNFFTVRLRPGNLEQIVVVMDEKTGDLLGAGEMSVYAQGAAPGRLGLTLVGVVGAGASLTSQTNVTGIADSTELTPQVFLDVLMQYNLRKHYTYGRLASEEAFVQRDWGRFQKTVDFLRLDLLYAYRLRSWMGPYVRAGVETTLFPGHIYFSSPTDVATPDGWIHSGQKQFRISPMLMPLTTKSGLGLRFNTLPSPWGSLWALAGAGGRYTFADSVYVVRDRKETTHLDVADLGSFWSYGVESSVVGQLILSRWVVANSEVEVFAPFDSLDRPTLRWDNNISFRITSFISTNYIYRMKFEPAINDGLQHDHQVQLRFSYRFF